MSRTFWLVSDTDRRTVPLSVAERQAFRADAIEVAMYSVGDGETIVLSRGGRTVLVDGGANSRQKRNDKLAAELASRLPSGSLCAIVASHPHQDHTNTYPALVSDHVSRFDAPSDYFDNATPAADTAFQRLQQSQPNLPIVRQPIPDQAAQDKQSRITRLDPETEAFLLRGSTNATTIEAKKYWSMFMLLRFRATWMLFTGDAHKNYENRLLPRLEAVMDGAPRIHLLKVTHHGSSSGTSPELVNSLNPAIAIASTAEDPGHRLEDDVRARLSGCAIYATFDADRPVHKEKDIIVRTDGRVRSLAGTPGILFEVWRRKPALSP